MMIENFSRGTTVEGSRNRSELLGAVPAQVSALGEVLAEQAVGVLIGPALPRAMRVTEVDRQLYVEAELRMLSHLCALVPGERSA